MSYNRRPSIPPAPKKRALEHDAPGEYRLLAHQGGGFLIGNPVRHSSRIASMGRTSYAELDEGPDFGDEYDPDEVKEEPDVWQHPAKRVRPYAETGVRMFRRKVSAVSRVSRRSTVAS